MQTPGNRVSHLKGASPPEFDHDEIVQEAAPREAITRAVTTVVTDLLLQGDVPREGQLVLDWALVNEGKSDQRAVATGLLARFRRSSALVRRL